MVVLSISGLLSCEILSISKRCAISAISCSTLTVAISQISERLKSPIRSLNLSPWHYKRSKWSKTIFLCVWVIFGIVVSSKNNIEWKVWGCLDSENFLVGIFIVSFLPYQFEYFLSLGAYFISHMRILKHCLRFRLYFSFKVHVVINFSTD